jgi:hypothetical protein
MDTPRSPAPDPLSALRALLAEQQANFNQYLLILKHIRDAVDRGDEGHLELYSEHEAACRQKIVAAAVALREHDTLAPVRPEDAARLATDRQALEDLRLEALRENTLTQERLGVTMAGMKNELAALSERLRSIEGGKSRDLEDPKFIDVYS